MASILFKNGRVWDGEKFFFADVLTDGEIVCKIEPGIEENADFAFDATGQTVAPGLVDAHVHISGGEFGTHPAMCTLPFGVTAAADAGVCIPKDLVSCGVKHALLINVNISNNHADFTHTQRMLSECGEQAIGLKIYFDRTISEVQDTTALCETVAFAEANGLIVMVHSSHPPVSMAKLMSVLRKGDIVTHAYHGGENNASDDGFAGIRSAQARGVIIDAGMAGHVHTDFSVLARAIQCGAAPNTISTDITKFSAYKRGGKYGLPLCMSIAKHLGMEETDIFKAVTSTPATALGKQKDWGKLAVGRCADLCVLTYTNEGFDLTDAAGHRVACKQGYRCTLTVSDGQVVYRY